MVAEKPEDYLFGEPRGGRAGGDFDSRYSQRGVQWESTDLADLEQCCALLATHSPVEIRRVGRAVEDPEPDDVEDAVGTDDAESGVPHGDR